MSNPGDRPNNSDYVIIELVVEWQTGIAINKVINSNELNGK